MMTRSLSSVVAIYLALLPPVLAQPIDVSALGPQVGQVVPDFRLRDAHGRLWTRDSLMGPKGAMLVFSRSADW
jgi:hypothetical protein